MSELLRRLARLIVAKVHAAWRQPVSDRVLMDEIAGLVDEFARANYLQPSSDAESGEPLSMRLVCPSCGELHVDEGRFARKSHHTHACQHCGEVWRPAVVPTVGVRFLPGFKDEENQGDDE